MTIQEREQLAIEYFKNNPELGHSLVLAKHMLQKHKRALKGLNEESLRVWLDRFYKKWSQQVINTQVVEEEKKWEVVDGYYIWETKRGQIKLSVSKIDKLFYEYSEKGLNLSQTEILNKYNFKPWEWLSIKNTLWLYKKAHIFSPYTVEITPPDQMESMIKEKMDKLFNNTGFQVEQQYHKALNKKFKDIIKKGTERDLELQTLVTELQDLLPLAKIEPIVLKNKVTINDRPLNVCLMDIHFGAENENTKLPLYSPDIVKARFTEIAEEINSHASSEVNIFIGGDIIESYTGLNHIDSWKGMAKGYQGARIVIEAYKALVEFISSVANVKSVCIVPGNHDRATDKKELDVNGSIAEIIAEFIRISFSNTSIQVKYDELLIAITIDRIRYIISHGDKKITDKPASELILDYGDPDCYFTVLVSGHWHERKTKKDHKRFRQLVCPPLFPGNRYSVESGYSVCAGYIIIINNGKNLPKVIDNSL